MSNVKIKFNKRKFERELNKIIEKNQIEWINNNIGSDNNMLNSNEEELLDIILSKVKDNKHEIMLKHDEYPEYMKFSIKDYLNKLKMFGLISHFSVYITEGCYIILTPAAFDYYNKKGSRKELFTELATIDKEFLKEIIEEDNKKGNLVEFLKNKIEKDEETSREIIGLLSSNGLLKVLWADDTIYEAKLTHNGKTFFEREKNYKEEVNRNSTYINAQNSNIFMGNIVNSTININNALDSIKNDIETKCTNEDEKEELRELLEEAKEIIDNYNQSNCITKRSGFFKKLVGHFDKHGWFYAEIVNLFGQFVLTKLSGQ